MDSPVKSYIKNSITPISLYDPNMRLLALSDAWKRMYHITDDQIGKIHYEAFHDLPAHWVTAHNMALAGKLSGHIEEPYLLSNGAMGWHRWQCSPYHGPDGEIKGIIIAAEDVTARKEREIELKNVLARFELIQQAAKIGMWDWDIEEKHITLNAEYYEILGWNVDRQISYQDFLHLIHPDDFVQVNEAMNSALEGNCNYEAEFRVIRMKDGKLRWVKDKGKIEFNDNGNPVRGYGAIIDVTEQKLLIDEKLIVARSERHNIFNSMPVGVSIVDRLGTILHVNDSLLGMLGYSEAEMVGKSVYNIVDARLREQAANNPNDRINGLFDQHEFCVKHKNGADVWLFINGQPLIEDGEIVGNIFIHVDFTQRKQSEIANNKRIEELERLLALRP